MMHPDKRRTRRRPEPARVFLLLSALFCLLVHWTMAQSQQIQAQSQQTQAQQIQANISDMLSTQTAITPLQDFPGGAANASITDAAWYA